MLIRCNGPAVELGITCPKCVRALGDRFEAIRGSDGVHALRDVWSVDVHNPPQQIINCVDCSYMNYTGGRTMKVTPIPFTEVLDGD